MRALDFGRHVGTPTTPNTNAPMLIKQVFDILVSLWFSHKMLCRSQILALGIYFWLFYAEHRKYYSKISWKKSRKGHDNYSNAGFHFGRLFIATHVLID